MGAATGVKLPQLDRKKLSFIMRNVLPGFLVIGFLSWRYTDLWYRIHTALGLLTAGIIIGAVFYYLHRALFHPVVIFIERHVCGVPQYDFHSQIAKEINAPRWASDIKVVQGCIYEVVTKICSQSEKEERWFVNSPVHALLMTSLFSVFALLHDVFLDVTLRRALLWLVPFPLFLAAGIATDYFWADEREVQLLRRYRRQYVEILRRRVS